ncbi:MAG: hypothetical protein MJ250_00660 [Alphaproteobacteria bacterium]|nr:hypothetical protein [Alphaproteobacteria bacterium]
MSENIFAENSSFSLANDIQFNTKIPFKLGENGKIVEFNSFYEAGKFGYEEEQHWINLIGKDSSDIPFVDKIISAQLTTPRDIASTAQAVLNKEISVPEGFSIIKRKMNNYLCYKCIYSTGNIGCLAKTMYHYEPMLLGLLAGALGAVSLDEVSYKEPADNEGFSFGYAMTMQYCTNIRPEMLDHQVNESYRKITQIISRVEIATQKIDDIENDNLSLRHSIDEANSQIQTYRNDVEKYIQQLVMDVKQTTDRAVSETWEQLNSIQSNHEQQLATLRQSVSSRIRYGTALDYWNNQLSQNQKQSNQMTIWYILSGLFAALLMGLMGILAKKYMSGTFSQILAMLLPFLSSGGLFYMLLQTKNSYEKNKIFAKEKVDLLETLASLETEESINSSESRTVLQGIFKTTFTSNAEHQEQVNQNKEIQS